ncbi:MULTISPECIES: hypothetical protein [Citrobacter]|uniref:hypothetical protein n=1 Tax=Citrobacter TaxID=544 RepID=UPI00128FC422|nr:MULTISPECIES: hypothetical protein [Citrobacter]ELB4228470.1 hypothetical protein [Citrobacter amalonaticus]MDM3527002.1 hypothetical protein [Citrobacter sp. Ca226]UYF56367.1 hypothetical protein M2R49_04075 [Citrobacter amalonaticus]
MTLHLFRHNCVPFEHEDGIFWNSIKIPGRYKLLNKRTLKENNTFFDELNLRLSRFLNDYALKPNEHAAYNSFVTQLNSKGMLPETAYQFIQGHVLYNNYVYPMLKMYRDKLYGLEMARIGKECKGVEKNGEREIRLGTIDNFYNKTNVLETLLNNTLNYTHEKQFVMLETKLKGIDV